MSKKSDYRRRSENINIAKPLSKDDTNSDFEKWLEMDRVKKPIAYNPHEIKRSKKFKKLSRKEYKELSKIEKKRYKRAKKRKYRVIRGIFKFFIIIILLALIAVGFLFSYVWSMLSNVNTIDLGDDLYIDSQVQTDLAPYKNILIAGVDAREGESFDTTRTDAIMILSLDTVNKEYRLISVYRDTLLEIETSEGEEYLGKINGANSSAGIASTVRALNKNMDLNIDEVVMVNWKTVADFVDGIGGIEVEIKDYEIDEMNKFIIDTSNNIGGSTELIEEAGLQNLNGVQAVTYARIRKVGNADFERTERMRVLVDASLKKMLTLDLVTLDSVAEQGSQDVVTSLNKEDILRLAFDLYQYKPGDNTGWPYLEIEDGSYLTSTGLVDGASTVIPRTLTENVVRLHELMFKQPDYEPTETVEEINDWITQKTGLY